MSGSKAPAALDSQQTACGPWGAVARSLVVPVTTSDQRRRGGTGQCAASKWANLSSVYDVSNRRSQRCNRAVKHSVPRNLSPGCSDYVAWLLQIWSCFSSSHRMISRSEGGEHASASEGGLLAPPHEPRARWRHQAGYPSAGALARPQGLMALVLIWSPP